VPNLNNIARYYWASVVRSRHLNCHLDVLIHRQRRCHWFIRRLSCQDEDCRREIAEANRVSRLNLKAVVYSCCQTCHSECLADDARLKYYERCAVTRIIPNLIIKHSCSTIWNSICPLETYLVFQRHCCIIGQSQWRIWHKYYNSAFAFQRHAWAAICICCDELSDDIIAEVQAERSCCQLVERNRAIGLTHNCNIGTITIGKLLSKDPIMLLNVNWVGLDCETVTCWRRQSHNDVIDRNRSDRCYWRRWECCTQYRPWQRVWTVTVRVPSLNFNLVGPSSC